MPLGTGATSAKNLPTEPYIITSAQWTATAKRNTEPIFTSQAPMGQAVPFTLPQVGICAELLITLDMKVVVATAAAKTTCRWPYGLLDTFSLGINGQQNLWEVIGEDLRVREDIAYPAYTELVDTFPGAAGAQSTVAVGTHEVHISWRVPVATELVTLAGALYLQSPSVTARCVLGTADPAALFTPATLANVSFSTPKWSVTETFFVPAYSAKGEIICPPGIQMLHAMTSIDLPCGQAGQNPLALVRGSGNLQRLYMSFRLATPTNGLVPFSATPTTPPAYLVDELILSYAQKQQPFVWTPASVLLRRNNLDYGKLPPYDYLVFDTLKWTAARDAVYYPGLTELKVLAYLGSENTAHATTAHLVQEDVFA